MGATGASDVADQRHRCTAVLDAKLTLISVYIVDTRDVTMTTIRTWACAIPILTIRR